MRRAPVSVTTTFNAHKLGTIISSMGRRLLTKFEIFTQIPGVIATLSLVVALFLYARLLMATSSSRYLGDRWAVEVLAIAVVWPILTVAVVKFWLVCRGERLRVHVLLVFVVIVLARGYERMISYSFWLRDTTEFIQRHILP